jgi:hypothetical protein
MSKPLDKAVTARFSRADYLLLQTEAERRGCSIADVIRGSWQHYQQQQQLQQLLLTIEQRQRKTQFEILCVVLDLATDERNQALKQLIDRGVKI